MELGEEIRANREKTHISENTNKILSKLKWDCFHYIFKLLDSDEDDSINKITMDLRRIPNKILMIIDPILQELRTNNENRNHEEFIRELDELFEVRVPH